MMCLEKAVKQEFPESQYLLGHLLRLTPLWHLLRHYLMGDPCLMEGALPHGGGTASWEGVHCVGGPHNAPASPLLTTPAPSEGSEKEDQDPARALLLLRQVGLARACLQPIWGDGCHAWGAPQESM